ncbi:MAG TPA: CsbD family protein [Pseudonocardiaceae bacterium]
MSDTGRFDDRVDQASGKAKEWAGRATDDRDLEAEGRTQHGVAKTKADVREGAEKVKDAVADTAHKVRDAMRR